MPPILSACLVMYRCGDEIDVALRCIQNADLEVSVFLSDNSPEELTAERLKWAFPGVVVIPQDKNVGISRAHNSILPQLQSKYHLMLDTGVSFHPSLLRRMIAYMEAHPNIAVLSPRFFNEAGEELFFPRKQLSIRYLAGSALSGFGGFFLRWQHEYTMADQNVEMPVPIDTAPIHFMLIRTEVFRNLNGFDPRFFRLQEDADLCRSIRDNRLGSIVYHPEMQVILRQEAKSNLLFANHVHSFKTVARYFIKWGITW
jgi:hypothetical protein